MANTHDKQLQQHFLGGSLGTATRLEDVQESFELLTDWEDRYAFIIDLGKQLSPFPEAEKREETRVHGCQSQVWLIHWQDPATQKLWFLIDSDALIVRGLAALILVAINGQTPQQLLATDIDQIFQQLDLFRHISPTRGNGLRAMMGRIRRIAEAV